VSILTGDIGGTSTRLAIVTHEGGRFRIDRIATYSSREFDGLKPIVATFLQEHAGDSPLQAAFGVAGPVIDGTCRTTNLPWELSETALSEALDISSVHLLNDLEAAAWGIDTLDDNAQAILQAGAPVERGNKAVIAAGTGLGQAGLTFDGVLHRPFACEGGHADFAARTERDIALLHALQARYSHVSWERLVSGSGLVELFRQTLHNSGGQSPAWLDDPDQDAAARISQHALAGDDALCVDALDWFTELYGREAGNLALKLNATGGLYLGGGIAPKILPALRSGRFMEAFLDKGRMGSLLATMPVSVICEKHVALYGLARYAELAQAT